MGRKIMAFAAIAAVAAIILAIFGNKLDSGALAVTGFAVGNAEGGMQTLTPADRITEDIIRTSDDAVLIRIANATIGKLESTNSMWPALDSNSTAIMIKPQRADELKEGDIIAYYSDKAGGLVVHRVVRIGNDGAGWFAITKGDNASANDPAKVRFGQVRYVIVGVLY